MKRMRLWIVILMTPTFTGCLGAPSNPPLTTADLERMATGRVHIASLERVGDGTASSLESNAPKMPPRLLRSLAPVISSKAAVGDMESEYVFVFQSGRNPVVFNICVRGDVLSYRVGDTDYRGGNAGDFLNAVNELTPLLQ